MTNPPTTTTLTDGAVGAFTLSGLAAGGALTLSFNHPGFAEAQSRSNSAAPPR